MMTVPAIDYTNRDYLSFRQLMLDSVATLMPEWSAGIATADGLASANDFGVVLIELFSYVADILSYYSDRVAGEAFLATATQRSSLLNLAYLLDYRPAGSSAASTILTFSSDADVDVLIPAGTEVTTGFTLDGDPVTFTTDADLIIPADSPSADVTATEGSVVDLRQIAVATGEPNQTAAIEDFPVVSTSIIVFVQEPGATLPTQWSFVEKLDEYGPNDRVYSTTIDEFGSVTLVFGNDEHGQAPILSAKILASYRIGGGESGNIDAGAIKRASGELPAGARVTNPVAAFGGASIEDTESIRARLPQTVTVQDRAVTTADYAALAMRVPGVFKAMATALVYTNVTVYIAGPGGGQPSNGLMNDVAEYLNARRMINVSILIGTPTYPTFDIAATVRVGRSFAQATVSEAVQASVRDMFSFAAVQFGQRVTVSDVYYAINSVIGVDYGLVTLLARTGATGVDDVLFADSEIPQIATLNITLTGGLIPGNVPAGTTGAGVAAAPAGAPTLDLVRCDPGGMHVEMHWGVGANTTEYTVQVLYYNGLNLVTASEYGPMVYPSAVLGVPLVGLDRGITTVSFRVRSWNGNVGPVDGPTTAIPYTCG